ncbi:MAG: CAP domain-containing protein [Candidatus Micrarchaeota archaeon]
MKNLNWFGIIGILAFIGAVGLLAFEIQYRPEFFNNFSTNPNQYSNPSETNPSSGTYALPNTVPAVPSQTLNSSDFNVFAKPDLNLSELEFLMHDAINRERIQNQLSLLKWNSGLANVARRHSNDLALENTDLTDFNLVFPDPYISHEGFSFGFHHSDRLHSMNIYYFSASAENILAHPFSKDKTYPGLEPAVEPPIIELPPTLPDESQTQTLQNLRQYLNQKQERIQTVPKTAWKKVDWETTGQIVQGCVSQWMNSPSHRQNILNGEYDEAGTGISEVNDYLIMTQVLIKRADCGFQNGPCCQKAGYLPYCFVPLECRNDICHTAS